MAGPRRWGARWAGRLEALGLGLGRAVCRGRAVGLGMALAVALVGGCTAPPQAQKPAQRQIEFWTLDLSPKFNGYLQAVIADWEALHPGVKVHWVDLPWGSVERKLLAAVFARTAPDVVNLNPLFAANLASKGGLLPLDPLLPAPTASSYLASIWGAGRSEGPPLAGVPTRHQYTLPWYLTTRITLANRQLLSQAGYAKPPATWAEVPAYAEAVKRRTGRYALFVTVVPDDSAELLESMVQMGVTLLDGRHRAAFNSPAGRRAFAFWSDLYRRGLLPREVVSQGYRRAIELYQSGDLAQVASGAEYLRAIGTNAPRVAAVTAPYPPLVGPDGASNVAVMNLAISRQSALPKEALSFALFLTDGPNQARFANQARVLPSAKAALKVVAADLDLERPADAQGRLVRQARQLSVQTLGQARVLVPPSPGVKRLQTVIYTQLQRAMLGQISSDRALAEAERQWNSYATARWP